MWFFNHLWLKNYNENVKKSSNISVQDSEKPFFCFYKKLRLTLVRPVQKKEKEKVLQGYLGQILNSNLFQGL